MKKTKTHGKRVNFFTGGNETSYVSSRLSSQDLIERVLKSLYKLQKDCENKYPIFLPKSSYESLQIALAFCYSKSHYKNSSAVKEILFILSQNEEALNSDQLIPILNGLINYMKEGRENYEMEEVLYLISNLAPLIYQASK